MLTYIIGICISCAFCFLLHVNNNGSFPKPLSAKEERECFEKMRAGDRDAHQKLILHNLRLVAHIVKKYYSTGEEQDDLISIGTIGLIKGINTFNVEKQTRFATYASRCIENEILMSLRANKKSAQDVYISEPIDFDKEGNALTLLDIISEDEDVVDKVDTKMKVVKLPSYINEVLDEREKEIIMKRYGIMGETAKTQNEIADELNISRSYVSRIEKKALQKLKDRFEK